MGSSIEYSPFLTRHPQTCQRLAERAGEGNDIRVAVIVAVGAMRSQEKNEIPMPVTQIIFFFPMVDRKEGRKG
jgi:hypothetical protein